ncbi:MAG: PstS family phosphate ABC transporter substrate-binding protein [Bacteroidota bacterium]|nr:PstS family phosphate ABC transporter substrate-binding protein [Bacteroidota bacterium]
MALFVLGCSQGQGTEKETGSMSGEVLIDGSSTVYPITEAVAEEFRNSEPNIQVTVGVSGTGGGFKKFGRGEIDINNASRSIKDEESAICAESNIKFVELAVAYDGLAVIVNHENSWVDHLTVDELKKIWEPAAQGKITRWNQIRPEWPDKELHLYGPGIASGTYDYFTEAIVGKSGSSRGDYTASEDDNVLVQGISNDPNALGFFGLAYFEENQEKLKLVGVNNGNEVVLPDVETVKNGTYKPLSRPVFIYVSDAAVKKPAVVSFVNFYLENARELVQDVGYILLPEEEYKKQKDKFDSFENAHSSKVN